MSEPTLEQIADEGFRVHVKPHRVANVLAREIIALRDFVKSPGATNPRPVHEQWGMQFDHNMKVRERVEAIEARLRALESQARPLQESARMHDVHADLVKRLRKAEQLVLDSQESEVRVIKERDAAIARAESERAQCWEACFERDAAREALRKIVDGSGFDAVTIAQAALDGAAG